MMGQQGYGFDESKLSHLRTKKKEQGETISVVIPTWNEAATIADIVSCLREKLMGDSGIIDELFVIDSGSTDGTREIAAAAGAVVHLASDIAPEHGDFPGKGENMWKSQFVSSGSIVVFLDGDVENFHAGYVSELCLPLLDHPEVKFVKAAYDRPFVRHGQVCENEGGRVTELLIRPLLSEFRNELSFIRQPLSGECAMRREVMTQLEFPCGYAVEIAHLLDVHSLYGISAIAQSDLGMRRHRNRPLSELADMARGLLRTTLEKCGVLNNEDKKNGLASLVRPAYDSLVRPHAL